MKSISNFQDLIPYGVNPLTGEACAYGMRILCDLSERGVQLVSDFLGEPNMTTVPYWYRFNQNWNTRVGEEVAIASIMLTRGTIWDMSIFALLNVDHVYAVYRCETGAYALSEDQYLRYRREDMAPSVAGGEWYIAPQHSRGDRNTHAFTGRTV